MDYAKFTKQGKLIKGIKLELVPQGNTRDAISEYKIVEADQQLADMVKEVVMAGNEFYKDFIKQIVGHMDGADWQAYGEAVENKATEQKTYDEAVKSISASIKNAILGTAELYGGKKTLFAKDFITIVLRKYVETAENFPYNRERILTCIDVLSDKNVLFKTPYVKWEHIIFGENKGSIAERMLSNFDIFYDNKNKYAALRETATITDFDDFFTDYASYTRYIGQDGIELYNSAISGIYSESGTKISEGINEYINKLKMKHPKLHVNMLKKLQKQILSNSEPLFKVATIQSAEELKGIMNKVKVAEESVLSSAKELLVHMETSDLRDLYISGQRLYFVCQKVAKDGEILEELIFNDECSKVEKLTEKKKEEIRDAIVKHDYSFAYIDSLLSEYAEKQVKMVINEELQKLISAIVSSGTSYDSITINPKWKAVPDKEVTVIRKYLESFVELNKFLKCLRVRDSDVYPDFKTYATLNVLADELGALNKAYNMVRNFVTKKVNDKDGKTRLCFGRGALLERGWNRKNQAVDWLGNIDHMLLIKDGKYYYAVPAPVKRKTKIYISDTKPSDEVYEYMEISKQSSFLKTFARLFTSFGLKNIGDADDITMDLGNGSMTVTKEFLVKYKDGECKKNTDFMHKSIDIAKEFLTKHYSYATFNFSELKKTEDYTSFYEFANDVDKYTYAVKTKYIDAAIIDKAVEDKELLLFMLSSMDLYKSQEKCKDITALYTRYFFSEENRKKADIWLNANPAIYYRKPLIKFEKTHPAGSILVRKTYEDKDEITHIVPDNVYMSLYNHYNKNTPLNEEAMRYVDLVEHHVAVQDYVKDARYTREMFTINLSFTLNGNAGDAAQAYTINNMVKEEIKAKMPRMLTVVRGYRNLLEYCVTDETGKVFESGNFNTIGEINFKEKLEDLDRARKADAQNWKYEKTVVNIKESYLGMVTSSIVKKAVAYNAIINVEQLSDAFKDKRSCMDNQVFKKFEEKLVSKLACYYDKAKAPTEPGGYLNPLQLASPNCLSNTQNGILFYVSPAYTNEVCPKSNFINLLDFSAAKTLKAKREFLRKMNEICYDAEHEAFHFSFCYDDMPIKLPVKEKKELNDKTNQEFGKHIWTVYTNGVRTEYNKKERKLVELNGTEILGKECAKNKVMLTDHMDVDNMPNSVVNEMIHIFQKYSFGEVAQKDVYYVSPTSPQAEPLCTPGELRLKSMSEKGYMILHNIVAGKEKFAVNKIEWLEKKLG